MTIYLYILKDYLKYVIGTVVLTVFLFVLFDFIHKTTKVDFNPPAELIIKSYAFQIPAQVNQAIPIAALLASVICMILLSRTNEITAMRAAGMGPARIAIPLGVGGLLLSLASFAIGELFIPRFAQRLHYIEEVQIKGETTDKMSGGSRWLRDGQMLVNYRDYDPITETLARVRLIQVRPNFRAAQTLESDIAVYAPDQKTWTLTDSRILHFKRTGTLERIEKVGDVVMTLPIDPTKMKRDRRKSNELTIQELNERVARGERSGANVLEYRTDLHAKFAYPLAAFVVSFIGLRFGYKSERATETVKGVLLAFFIGISYWIVLSSARTLGMHGSVHPLVAAWAANFVTMSIVLFDAWRARKL